MCQALASVLGTHGHYSTPELGPSAPVGEWRSFGGLYVCPRDSDREERTGFRPEFPGCTARPRPGPKGGGRLPEQGRLWQNRPSVGGSESESPLSGQESDLARGPREAKNSPGSCRSSRPGHPRAQQA